MSSEASTHYQQKVAFCGKKRCKKCRDGIGHGPYWYASEKTENGTIRTYLGAQQQAMEHVLKLVDLSLMQEDLPRTIQLLDQLLTAEPTNRAVIKRLIATLVLLMKHATPLRRPARLHRSALVGRDQEQKRLQAFFHARNTHLPQCIFLTGDAGLGKTRLAEELAREAAKQGWSVLWGHTYVQESRFSYTLWSEVLRQLFSPYTIEPYLHLLGRCPTLFEPLGILLPYIQECFAQPEAISTPAQEPRRLWEAIGDLLVLMSQQAPLLLVLDDLQWMDTASGELLGYVVRRLQGHAAMLVGTCREHELLANPSLHTLLTDLQREQMAECLALTPLDDEQMQTLLSDLQVPQPLLHSIRSRAAGNPFFAEELAHTFDNGQDLVADHVETSLPDTIAAVLDMRLNRLSQPCQRILSKAAVLGGSFEFPLISAMEAGVPGSSDSFLLDLLEEALNAGILIEQSTHAHAIYTFWHPLLATHLYEKLSAARRISLHRRAATLLQQLYHEREEEVAARITHHLVEGGAEPQRLAQFAVMAGNRAYTLSAYADARHHYDLAVKQLEEIDAHPGLQSHDRERLLWLRICLAECLRIMGCPLEARSLYEQALASHEGRIPFSQEEAQIRALLYCELGLTWYDTQHLEQALACYTRGERCLRAAQVNAGPAWARLRYEQSYTHWRTARYDEALRLATNALALFTELLAHRSSPPPDAAIPHVLRISRTFAGDPTDLGRTHQLLGLIANGAGHSIEARSHLEEALRLFEQYQCRREVAIVCCNLGDVYLRRAEYDQAQVVLLRCLQNAEEIGDLPLTVFARGNLAILNIRRGHMNRAEMLSRQAVEMATRMQDVAASSFWMTYLGITLTEQGRFSEACTVLAQALQKAHAAHLPPYLGQTLNAVAYLRLAQREACHDADRRQQFLQRARHAVLHALGQEGGEAEAILESHLLLAQIALREGDTTSAYQQAHTTLIKAQQAEGKDLIARAQRLIDNILAIQEHDPQTVC